MVALSQLNQNVWWYFARAGGLVAWGVLATSVFWGLIYAGRLTRKVPPPAWNFDLHRFLGGLSVTFVAIHVLALTADKYVNFGLSQVLVPFASHWRPGAVAWGIVAFYLLIAVEATSLAMRWLPRKLWRQIHLLSFLLFAFSTLHAIQTGTDTHNLLVRAIGIGLLVTATVTAVLRIAQARRRATKRTTAPVPHSPDVAPPEPVVPQPGPAQLFTDPMQTAPWAPPAGRPALAPRPASARSPRSASVAAEPAPLPRPARMGAASQPTRPGTAAPTGPTAPADAAAPAATAPTAAAIGPAPRRPKVPRFAEPPPPPVPTGARR